MTMAFESSQLVTDTTRLPVAGVPCGLRPARADSGPAMWSQSPVKSESLKIARGVHRMSSNVRVSAPRCTNLCHRLHECDLNDVTLILLKA